MAKMTEDAFFEYPTPGVYKLKGDDVRYLNVNDANMRLGNGFVLFKNTPVFLGQVSEQGYFNATSYDNKYSGLLHMNDSRIDITSPPLGWVNTVGYGPIFLRRGPARQQQQSLGTKLCDIFMPFSKGNEFGSGFYHPSGTGVSLYAVGRTIAGEFQTIKDCLEHARGGAFSREWAIAREKQGRGYVLFHNQFSIGYYLLDKKTFLIMSDELTKTRMRSLNDEILKNGGGYDIQEHHSES